jgi:hypothetical protein
MNMRIIASDRPRITRRCPDLYRAEAGGFPDRPAVHSDHGPLRWFAVVGYILPGRRHRSPGLERSWHRVRSLMGNLGMAILRCVWKQSHTALTLRMPRVCKFINATDANLCLRAPERYMAKADRKSEEIQDFRAAEHRGQRIRRSTRWPPADRLPARICPRPLSSPPMGSSCAKSSCCGGTRILRGGRYMGKSGKITRLESPQRIHGRASAYISQDPTNQGLATRDRTSTRSQDLD